ncbi:MAG: UDP-glucose/GDP-mannose dehydrogenase family protein [Proteobacteria bacterium]|nr:UDP-glucose/GDP-mannose dehydrogenase family protein [Pseudomonadota bacterium]
MKIAVIGTGYVGLVSGTCLAEVGHQVTCIDLDEHKINQLKNATSPIYEPGLETLIKQNIDHERLHFSTRIEDGLLDCDVAFIAVGTPEGEDGSADLKYVKAAAKSIGEKCKGNLLVVVKSTVPVGTCDLVEQTIQAELKKRNVSFVVSVGSNPEFLKEGAAVQDFMHPDRIVCGVTNDRDAATFKDLYGVFVIDDPSKIFIVDRKSSELIKYGSNAMLATRITFMNELARLCEKVGADIDHVRRGMGSDVRIGRKFLWAGPGYGGSCFPKDVAALVQTGDQNDVNLSLLKAVTSGNEAQKLYVASKISRHFNGNLSGKKIAVWGLAFKPGTDDVREAPAAKIIEELPRSGATVVGHDPQGCENFQRDFGNDLKITYSDDPYAAVKGTDALVLVTEWPEYKRPNFSKIFEAMKSKNIFDFRNQWSYPMLKKLGFHYECIGRPDDSYKVTI